MHNMTNRYLWLTFLVLISLVKWPANGLLTGKKVSSHQLSVNPVGPVLLPPLCAGALSDNIYPDGTFGTGTDTIFQADPGYSLDYLYQTTNTTPPPGSYTLVNHTGNWLPLNGTDILETGDFSTDTLGYMLVVNTTDDDQSILWMDTVAVCETTTYEITVSFLNLLDPNALTQPLPSVDIGIAPLVYQSTGAIPQDGNWHSFSFEIFTPPGITELPLFLQNSSTNALGSLVAIDNILIQACGPSIEILSGNTVCANDTLDLIASLDGTQLGNMPFLQWQESTNNGATWMDIPGATDTIYTVQVPVDSTQYRLLVGSSVANLSNTGCSIQSEVILLEVLPVEVTDLIQTICQGDTVFVNGNAYTQTGNMTDTLAATTGCDSIVNLDLTVLPNPDTLIVDTICLGEVYLIGQTPYFQAGFFSDTIQAVNGCDSIVDLNLTVLPNSDSLLEQTICFGDTVFVGTTPYFEDGFFITVLPSANGCDSTVSLNLTVLEELEVDVEASICEGEFYFIGNTPYFEEGQYTDTIASVVTGCDSIVHLDLEVRDTAYTSINATICAGEFYPVGNNLYFQTGQHIELLSTFTGCDSTVELNLNVLDTAYTEQSFVLCEGESISVGTSTYTTTGLYFDTLDAITGCDSVVRTNLTVNDTVLQNLDIILCLGETYQGMQFGVDTVINEFLQTTESCDSTVIKHIFVSDLTEVVIKGDSLLCNNDTTNLFVAKDDPLYSYKWSSGQQTRKIFVNQAGTYTVTVTDDLGCELVNALTVRRVEIEAEISALEPTCFGSRDGSISVDTFYGGDGPYSFGINDRIPKLDPVFTGLPAGPYNIIVTDANGCSWEGYIEIEDPEALIVELGPDLNISLNDTVTILPQVNRPVVEVNWLPGSGLSCDNCLNPIASPFETTEYEVRVFDEDGCRAVDVITIKIGKIRNVYIPSAFSPNYDGDNDFFTIFGGDDVVRINRLLIFDRWGSLVFENGSILPGDETQGWDGRYKGRDMPEGVYVYWAELLFIDDNTRLYEGGIHLIR